MKILICLLLSIRYLTDKNAFSRIPTGDSCGAGAGPLNAISLCASGLCEITCQSSGLPCSLGNCIQNGNGVVGSGTLCLQNSECQASSIFRVSTPPVLSDVFLHIRVGFFVSSIVIEAMEAVRQLGVLGNDVRIVLPRKGVLSAQIQAVPPVGFKFQINLPLIFSELTRTNLTGRCDWNSQTESGTFICLPSVGSVRVGGNCTTDSDCSTGSWNPLFRPCCRCFPTFFT